MDYHEGYLKSGHRNYYQYWLPEGAPKAAMVVVHGLAEHCGRYGNIVDWFVPQGYAVYGIDHCGHGKTDGTRVYVNSFNDFIDPLKTYIDMVHSWQPNLPVYLVGHSMGGLISTVYLLDYQSNVAGAILSGALVKIPDNINNFTINLGKLLSAVTPKTGLVGLDASLISKDASVVEAYVNDPLVTTGKTTARLSAELLGAIERVVAEASKIILPVLITHGSEDQLVNPQASQLLYNRISSKDKMLKIYNGLYHEVYNEPERAQVLSDVQAWLENHLK